jgi:hypothetical protein
MLRNHGYNALAEDPGAASHLLRSIGNKPATEEVVKVEKIKYYGSIPTLRSLADQRRDVCKVLK